jgi:hypothetical protein
VNFTLQVDQRAGVNIFLDNQQARYSDRQGNLTCVMRTPDLQTKRGGELSVSNVVKSDTRPRAAPRHLPLAQPDILLPGGC